MKLNEYNSSTSVYLEQMSNHIELGQGYSHLRKLLFRELYQAHNGDIVSDDKLSQSIISFLATSITKTVNFHRSQQTFRILQIIEDLLTYADQIITPVMNDQIFISALISIASPKIVTFDSKTDTDCRNRVLSIFGYWFNRYGRDEQCKYELFIQGYKKLKEMKLGFPNDTTIKPNDYFKIEIEKQKGIKTESTVNTNLIILQDIQKFTVKTQLLLKQNFKSVANTQYVRLIKIKSKTLFDFTSKPNDFKDKQKNLVKDLYRRLRVVLKEIQKFKETSLQTKKSQQTQKQYVETKMTPKKPVVQIDLKSPNQKKRQGDLLETKPDFAKQVIDIKTPKKIDGPNKNESIDLLDISSNVNANKISKIQQKKISSQKQNLTTNVDLLNNQNKPIAQQQQQFIEGIVVNSSTLPEKESKALFQVFSTPKKQIHEQDGQLLKKQSLHSNQSAELSPAFQNQKKAKNIYSYIPDNLNLTPTSSVEDQEDKIKQKPAFSFFGLLNFGNKNNAQVNIYENQNLHYDSPHKKGKAFSEQQTKPKEFVPIQLPPQAQDIVTLPNYRPVQPINYDQYANVASPSQNEEQENRFYLTPKKSNEGDLKQIELIGQRSGEKIKSSQ